LANLILDDDDEEAMRKALQNYPIADIGPPEYWAWKQKEIKALNRTDNGVLVTSETRINQLLCRK
jgi:COMPASS (Complex proteins associated with Set1p) component N